MTVKSIRFQYFISKVIDRARNQSSVFDFNRWLHVAAPLKLNDRIRTVRGTTARLDYLRYYPAEEVWGLRFMRLRDDNIPFIVKADANAEDLELDKDEYVGEGLHVLYDRNHQLFMIQSNRFSLGISALENYLNAVWDTPGETLYLQPFQEQIDLPKYRKDSYKTITLRFANLDTLRGGGRGTKSLEGILSTFNRMECRNAEIRLSLGHSRQPSLNRDQVHDMLMDIHANRDIISSAKLACSDGPDGKSEVIDLLDFVEESRIRFRLPERAGLAKEYAFREMIQEYGRKKEVLLGHLQCP